MNYYQIIETGNLIYNDYDIALISNLYCIDILENGLDITVNDTYILTGKDITLKSVYEIRLYG